MSLTDKINNEIKEAMKAKNQERLKALRAVKSALLLAQSEKGAGGQVAEDVEVKILQKQVKQRKESAQVYKEQGRDDLAEPELKEAAIIEEFLPKMMSEDELRPVIKEIIEQTGASGMQDMGKVMGTATKQLAGKADNKLVSQIVREMLG
jgi:uncharacterized protein YqeY